MFRIFLTGDNHIGLKYASHEKAQELAEARIDAFSNMVKCANDEKCDLFVIAGDLFENTYGIARKDLRRLINMLSEFHGTVAVLPGNHDYYDKDVKIWKDFQELRQDYDNIMLLNEYRTYPANSAEKEAVIYPAFCTSLHSEPNENNLEWIRNENIVPDDTIRIGIAHGAVEGETIDREGRYFLMTRSELENIPMDVWLIGHTHVPFPSDLQQNTYTAGERIFNAGTHVQTDVSCNTEGLCFIIEIDDDKTVRAKKIVSGNLGFFRKQIKVTAGNMAAEIEQSIKNIPDNSVAELNLTGAVTDEEYRDRNSILESALKRFTESSYNDEELSRLISKELIEAEFAETSFSAHLLEALINEPKEAQLVYELLKSMKEEK